MTERDKTNPTFAILSALGIIFVVSGHIPGIGGISFFYDWFPAYSFHIALFVFIAGYFYKDESERKPFAYIFRKFKRFIIPLYVWNAVYGVVVWLLSLRGLNLGARLSWYNLLVMPLVTGHPVFQFNVGSWFLGALFFAEVVNVLIRRITGKTTRLKELLLAAAYLAIGIFGVWLSLRGFNTGIMLPVTRTMFFLACFAFGRIYKVFLEKYDTCDSVVYFAVLFAVQLVLFLVYGRLNYTAAWSSDFVDPVAPFLASATGIAFWLRVSKLLAPSLGNSRHIRYIAKNTFSIMLHHFLGIFLLNAIMCRIYMGTGLLRDFSWSTYVNNLWYFYFPGELKMFGYVYLAFGVGVPLLLCLARDAVKRRIAARAKGKQVDNNVPV